LDESCDDIWKEYNPITLIHKVRYNQPVKHILENAFRKIGVEIIF